MRNPFLRSPLTSVIAILVLLFAAPANAQFNRVLVTTGGDPDPSRLDTCSLRQALLSVGPHRPTVGGCVREVNSIYQPSLVEMSPALVNHKITLAHGELEALVGQTNHTYRVTLRGHGLVVDAAGASRVLRVGDATLGWPELAVGHLTLEDLTLTGGYAEGPDPPYAGVPVVGKGGGIYMEGRTSLILRRVQIIGNRAVVSGGGLQLEGVYDPFLRSSPTLLMYDSTIRDNEATGTPLPNAWQRGAGGGVALYTACGQMVRSTFSGNRAGYGGAIWASNPLASSQTCEHFDAGSGVGGLVWQALRLVRSTISGNTTRLHDGVWDYGGAAIEADSPVLLNGSTITDNHGGLLPAINFVGEGSLEVVNSIVSGNTVENPGFPLEFPSPDIGVHIGTSTYFHSLLGTQLQGAIAGTGVVFSDAPGLGMLADHGGLTLTHLPAAGSAAVGIGRAAECNDVAQVPRLDVPGTVDLEDQLIDQRHLARPVVGACDAGAVQRRAGSFTIAAVVVGAGEVDATPTPSGAGSSGGILACTEAGGSACSATFVDENEPIRMELSATAAPGWSLGSWSGDCVAAAGGNTAALLIDGNRSCSVVFVQSDVFRDGFEPE